MVMGRFSVSYEKQNYFSVLRPSLLSCPFTLATGSKTHSHHTGLQRACRRAEWKPFLCLHAALVRHRPKQSLLAQGRRAAEPLCACAVRASKADPVSKPESWQGLWSWHDSWQVAYCYYYYSTLACKHDPEQEANMSWNNWLPSQQGFKLARRTISVTGKQRQGSSKTNGKYLWRGRCSKDTNRSVKCLGCAETVRWGKI